MTNQEEFYVKDYITLTPYMEELLDALKNDLTHDKLLSYPNDLAEQDYYTSLKEKMKNNNTMMPLTSYKKRLSENVSKIYEGELGLYIQALDNALLRIMYQCLNYNDDPFLNTLPTIFSQEAEMIREWIENYYHLQVSMIPADLARAKRFNYVFLACNIFDSSYTYNATHIVNNNDSQEENDTENSSAKQWSIYSNMPLVFNILTDEQCLLDYLKNLINHELECESSLVRNNRESWETFKKRFLPIHQLSYDDFVQLNEQDKKQYIYDLATLFILLLRHVDNENVIDLNLYPSRELKEANSKFVISMNNTSEDFWHDHAARYKSTNVEFQNILRIEVLDEIHQYKKKIYQSHKNTSHNSMNKNEIIFTDLENSLGRLLEDKCNYNVILMQFLLEYYAQSLKIMIEHHVYDNHENPFSSLPLLYSSMFADNINYHNRSFDSITQKYSTFKDAEFVQKNIINVIDSNFLFGDLGTYRSLMGSIAYANLDVLIPFVYMFSKNPLEELNIIFQKYYEITKTILLQDESLHKNSYEFCKIIIKYFNNELLQYYLTGDKQNITSWIIEMITNQTIHDYKKIIKHMEVIELKELDTSI